MPREEALKNTRQAAYDFLHPTQRAHTPHTHLPIPLLSLGWRTGLTIDIKVSTLESRIGWTPAHDSQTKLLLPAHCERVEQE